MLLVAYYVIRWPVGIGAKYGVIVAATFAGTVFLYEFVIRRVAILRLLFGLKPAPGRATREAEQVSTG